MMRLPTVIIVLTIHFVAAGIASSTISFYQTQTTTKRGGVAPTAPPIVGAPRADQDELQRRQQEERARALDLIQRQRMQQEQSGQQEAAPPEQPPAAATAADSRSGDLSARGGGVDLTFRNAPIDTVVDAIMRELGYSYVIDPQVTGNVNIFTMRQIPRAQLFGVLEQLLKMNGYAIVRQEGMYVIVPIGEGPRVPHQILVKPSSRTGQGTQPTTGEAPGSPAPGAGQEPEATQQEQEGEAEEAPPAEGAEATPGQAPQAQTPAQEEEPTAVELATSPEAAQLSEEEGIITYIIPLNFIPSDQMLTMAQAFVSGGATVVNFQPANTLIVTDYRQNIQQVLNLVNLLDTQYFDVNTVDLIPIRFNQAEDVAEDLGKIFAPGETTAGVRIVAIERLNSVLVVTRTPEAFTEVTKWIARLDAPSTSSNVRTFVYQVENNTAVQIAQILAELFQDGSGLPSGGDGTRDSENGTRTPTQDAGFVDRNRFANQAQGFGGTFGGAGLGGGAYGTGGYGSTLGGGYGGSTYGGRFGGRGGFGGGGYAGQLGPSLSDAARSQIRSVNAGNVKIVINEFNNSLIIQGSEADIQFILDTVKQLDTLPRQVLIEAKIYSVELRDELSFGVAAFLQERGAAPPGNGNGDGDGNGTSTTAASGPATTGSIGTDPGGQLTITSRAFIGAERELLGIINALRRKTDVKIVESPRLLTMDGTAATINIGAEVPVTTSSFGDPIQSGTTSFINSIQFRPTGTTLLIIPRISASGVVTMDLAIEVSNATGQALTPTINRNYVQTSLLVQDGQTIGLAGLISDSEDLGRNRVPVLGDIPIVGALFGQTTRDSRRSELIIFITPHVITDVPTAAELTLDFKRALRNSYEFIERKEMQEDQLIRERRLEELERRLEEQEEQEQQ